MDTQTSTYGQACVQCYKAKTRCVARPSGACERCFRLKRQCQASESVRRRGQQSREMGAQIAQLENKIETLTSILNSVVRVTGFSVDSSPSTEREHVIIARLPNSASIPGSSDALVDYGPTPPINVNPSGFQSCPSPLHILGSLDPSLPPIFEPSNDEAEQNFHVFRHRMLPLFPFIHISLAMTTGQLRQDRPLLFQAILAVATPSTGQKVRHIEDLKLLWAKLAVTQNASSIDMLLSILTYITWSTDPFMERTSSLSRMMMLAISMAYDIQQARAPLPEAQIIAKIAPGLDEPDFQVGDQSTKKFLEQQRAILACYVLSCHVSSYFGRLDQMRWTSQMEEGLRIIGSTNECPSFDNTFIFQVRLQLLAQKVAEVREQHTAVDSLNRITPPSPPSIYIKFLQGELAQLKASRSQNLLHTDMLNASLHYVELCINETIRRATSSDPLVTKSQPNFSVDGNVIELEPMESLWRSLQAAKAWLDCFDTVSPSVYLGFPFFYWFQLVRCLVILKHLSTFQDPAWDRDRVYKAVDLLGVLDRMASQAELASQAANEQSEDDMFNQVARCLRLSQQWVHAKWNEVAQADEEPPSLSSDNASVGDLNQAPWMEAFETSHESWIEDFFDWSPGTL